MEKTALGDGVKIARFTFFFVFLTMSRDFACPIRANDSNFSEYLKYKNDKVFKSLL